MIKHIPYILLIFTGLLLSCSDDFTSDLDPEKLSREEKLWLADDDGNGVADSIHKYSKDCELTIEECLELAYKEKEKE